MKDAYYFRHDSNAQNDPKILALIDEMGPAGVGLYWLLLESMRDQEGFRIPLKRLNSYARKWNTDRAMILKVVEEFELFEVKDGEIFSPSFIRRMSEMNEIRQIRSYVGEKGGKKSGEVRRAKAAEKETIEANNEANNEANVKQNRSKIEANHEAKSKQNRSIKGKESKVKESKVKESKVGEACAREETVLPQPPKPNSPPPFLSSKNSLEDLKTRLTPEYLKTIAASFRFSLYPLEEFTKDWIARKEMSQSGAQYPVEKLIEFYLKDAQKELQKNPV